MKKEMLINVLQPEECRIAIIEDGVLEELYVERASQESYVNNIYKGRIVNIEPSIQAAFVDFGIGRNGFLHVSDVDPVYYKHLQERGDGRRDRGDRPERAERPDARRERGGPRRQPFTPVEIPNPDSVPVDPAELAEKFDTLPTAPVAEFTPVPQPRPTPPVEDFEEEEEGGFGAGLLDDDSMTDETPLPFSTEAEDFTANDEPTAEPESQESEATEEEGRSTRRRRGAAPSKSGEKKPRAAARKSGSAKVEEKKPTRRRTTKKKADDTTTAPEGTEGDDKPLPMPSAEQRTTGDDAPEEFGGGIFVFDPTAPNDRFTEKPVPEKKPRHEEIPVAHSHDFNEAPEAEAPFAEEVHSHVEDVDDLDELQELDEMLGDEMPSGGRPRISRDRDRDRGPRRGGKRTFSRDGGRPKPPIQEIFKRGQEVIVQVIKEGIGTKGPTLSTYISIAGRYLVLMPSLNRLAVSRKIEDQDIRVRLKDSLDQLSPPKGIGFIIRTAAIDRNKQELQNDLTYLVRLWEVFTSRVQKRPSPVEIYRESDMITRTIRDIFTNDIDTIYVDELNAFNQASEFLKIVMPRFADRIKHYAETEPLFHRYKVEQELVRINEKKLPLPMGGSIVIEQTEALVAIDVNSGNFRADNNFEENAYQMNLQAAKEIGRQLRLRDLGGVVACDFIDMKEERHRRNVEQALRNALLRDRARTKILKTSQFGVIEMTRQRIRPSLKRSIYMDCPHCRATGYVKTSESMSIELMRLLQLAAHRKIIRTLEAKVHPAVAQHLLNKKRRDIAHWEELGQMQVTITGVTGMSPEHLEFSAHDNNGNDVKFLANETAAPTRALPDRRPGNDRDGDREERGGGGHRGDRDDHRGGDRGGDRGGERGGHRGGDRGGDRGGHRGGNRGGDRGGDRGGHRGGGHRRD